MIELRQGNILAAEADALVNTVNCVGIMGRGIALQFKEAFPDNFKAYARACKAGEVQPGRMFVFSTGALAPPKYIVNFPTKRHWRGKSRIQDIELGLQDLVKVVAELGLGSVAIPPLGAGLGGLQWNAVLPLVEAMARRMPDAHVIVYEPLKGQGEPAVAKGKEPPKMTTGRAVLVLLMAHYRKAILDPFITLLAVHKLLYLDQEAGEPLRLRFEQAPYGPYANNVRHVLNAVEGYFVSGYDGGGDNPDKPLDLVPGSEEEARAFLADAAETRGRLDRVFRLIAGWETPHGLELLSTVHWVTVHEHASNIEEVVAKTYAWNERKRQFTPRQIELSYRALIEGGWI